MIVTVGSTITRIGHVKPGSLVFNEGQTVAYVDTDTATVIAAPASTAYPVQPASAIPWSGREGVLYGIDPTGGNPGIGITLEAGLPFPAPINSGPNLVIPELHSPNFATGVSGWSIRKDGSAEFNNIIIRNGQIVSGAALYYSVSPPAFGKMVASVASASGVDSKGNAYIGPGVFNYVDTGGGVFYAVGIQDGTLVFYTSPTEAGPWTVQANIGIGATLGSMLIQSGGVGSISIAASGTGQTILLSAPAPAGGVLLQGGLSGDKISLSNAGSPPLLQVTNTGGGGTPNIRSTVNALGDLMIGTLINGDTNGRHVLDSSATFSARMRLGPGNAAPDVTLGRVNANLFSSPPIVANFGGTVEADTAFTFANSWTQTAGRAATTYRRTAVTDTVEIVGAVTVPAGVAANQNMTAAIPAAYQPVSNQSLIAIDTTNDNILRITLLNTGQLQFSGPAASTASGHNLDIPCQQVRLSS